MSEEQCIFEKSFFCKVIRCGFKLVFDVRSNRIIKIVYIRVGRDGVQFIVCMLNMFKGLYLVFYYGGGGYKFRIQDVEVEGFEV